MRGTLERTDDDLGVIPGDIELEVYHSGGCLHRPLMPQVGRGPSFLRVADGFRHVIFVFGIHRLSTSRPFGPSRIEIRSIDLH